MPHIHQPESENQSADCGTFDQSENEAAAVEFIESHMTRAGRRTSMDDHRRGHMEIIEGHQGE